MHKLKDSKVMVTGASSMIGRNIITALSNREAKVFPVYHDEYNLISPDQTYEAYMVSQPDYVIHAAGFNGGIKFNKEYPATIFYRTSMMALNVLEMARAFSVHKTVSILASCSYPDIKKEKFEESDLWNGKSHDSVECHGLSKRVLDAFSRQVSKQYPLTQCVSTILTNSYGPYDSYDPNKTKVVGALIKKFVDAKDQGLKKVECWGTGAPLRDFLFSEDAGELIVQVLEKYDDPFSPINLGSGTETSIKELTEVIAELVGYQGEIVWDTSKPDGQYRKFLSTDKMQEVLDVNVTPLKDGLRKTIDWYKNNANLSSSR